MILIRVASSESEGPPGLVTTSKSSSGSESSSDSSSDSEAPPDLVYASQTSTDTYLDSESSDAWLRLILQTSHSTHPLLPRLICSREDSSLTSKQVKKILVTLKAAKVKSNHQKTHKIPMRRD